LSEKDPILGIDLGTSKTCVGVVDPAGMPRLLGDASGKPLVPSVVSFVEDGSVLVGSEAKERLSTDSTNTLSCERWGAAQTFMTRAGEVTRAQVKTILLDHMRRLADAALSLDTRRAVLTMPAGFAEPDRQVLQTAAAAAGIEVERLLTDPAAVGYAYRLDEKPAQSVAVVDFGGGKLECTLLRFHEGTPSLLSTFAKATLGGIHIDQLLAHGMMEAFQQVHQVDLQSDPQAMERMLLAAEAAKCDLSTKTEVSVQVESVATSLYGRPLHLKLSLPRVVFLERVQARLCEALPVCDEALRRAGVAPAQVAYVLMTGGMARMPYLRDLMTAHFGRQPIVTLPPEDVVALGAARLGAKLLVEGERARRTTASYGHDAPTPADASPVPTIAGMMARAPDPVGGAPARVARIATKKMFTAVMTAQPDVAFTPARPVLMEVTAGRLAVSTVGGFCDEVVPSNQPIPVAKTRVFSTGKDDQPAVLIRLCQGDSRRFDQNRALGTLVLDNLPKRPRGQVRIAVTFAVDPDGVLEALAKDEQTGQARSVRIQLGGG
jgi:molecular chaperone DnaK